MWSIIHKMGSPPWFFRFSGTLVRWLLPVTISLLLVGAFWGLLVAPPDFRQGNSYRIIYIHVPAAVVALAGYYVMALAGAVSLIWRIKMADITMRAAAPVGAVLTAIALVTGAIWGKADLGRVVGLGCADYVHAHFVFSVSRRGRFVSGLRE